ncbi:hypothetical protein AAFF_G00196890 [Aldrovandia affinis]|uniref:Uncharacterized protein n=1 Tax=Aldrovandia affinis TaxID=143900 RepID=A0AAD7W5D1_9TELE|nr:hypothetical protein AAFF_G00196890 [Aldrovandia affinis]
MRCYRRLLGISYTQHITNMEIRQRISQAIGRHDDLLTIEKAKTGELQNTGSTRLAVKANTTAFKRHGGGALVIPGGPPRSRAGIPLKQSLKAPAADTMLTRGEKLKRRSGTLRKTLQCVEPHCVQEANSGHMQARSESKIIHRGGCGGGLTTPGQCRPTRPFSPSTSSLTLSAASDGLEVVQAKVTHRAVQPRPGLRSFGSA